MRQPIESAQYTSGEFTQTLADHEVLASIGSVGDAYDNALAESFVDTFKTELISDRVWRTRSQMEIAIVEYVGWFNQARLHESLGDRSPDEFESLAATRYGPLRNTNNTNQTRQNALRETRGGSETNRFANEIIDRALGGPVAGAA